MVRNYKNDTKRIKPLTGQCAQFKGSTWPYIEHQRTLSVKFRMEYFFYYTILYSTNIKSGSHSDNQPVSQFLCHRSASLSVIQSVNQSLSHSIIQSLILSVNQSANQSRSHSVSQALTLSVNQSANQSVTQSASQSSSYSVSQSFTLSVRQSIIQLPRL